MMSLSMFIVALKSLWWLGWVGATAGWLLFFAMERAATQVNGFYRDREQGWADQCDKWQALYKEQQRLSLDLLKVHQPEDYEEAIQGLSEIYARDILKRNARH
jgi:hypothetical protein